MERALRLTLAGIASLGFMAFGPVSSAIAQTIEGDWHGALEVPPTIRIAMHIEKAPAGDWKVTGTDWHPVFHYDPDLFWDAKPGDVKATIKSGPNNPVGSVWVSLNLEHYGLHGTPEPGHVGHTESHGCVRLTNWDAARVAALVKPGTPVLFR